MYTVPPLGRAMEAVCVSFFCTNDTVSSHTDLSLSLSSLVMGHSEEVEDAGSLVYAPTWAVASVCFVFIVCSLIVERTIFAIGQFWRSHKQLALFEALERIKEELMVVGFISLALTVGSSYVTKICVPKEWTNFMPLCIRPEGLQEQQNSESTSAETPSPEQVCSAKGTAEFIHSESLHQLHIFIFSLAVVHVVYSVTIMALGTWKVHQWRGWENMSSEMETASAHGGLRYTKDATFIKRHVAGEWSRISFLSHIAAFFQQFYQSVSSTDYLTLRHGFIRNHGLQNFNFHVYIMRSLEEDFKHVVGISPPLWGYMVLLILLNVEGWGMLYWSSLIPFIMVLVVGAKLRHIITQMAILCLDKHVVIEGIPAVKPSDDLFWFGRPRLILSVIHFILFQDALEVAIHLWSTLTFTKSNCFNRSHYLLAGRLILGLISQILCGYVVLPIYALVSQMGSEMKELDDKELGVLRLHEDESGDPTKGPSGREGSIPVAANSIDDLHGAEVGDGDMKGEGGCDDSIMEVHDSQDGGACVKRRMSYMERVARGIHGEDYHKLEPSTLSG